MAKIGTVAFILKIKLSMVISVLNKLLQRGGPPKKFWQNGMIFSRDGGAVPAVETTV